jgi:hypothetical protein
MQPVIWASPSLREPRGTQHRITWTAFAARALAPADGKSKESLSRWSPCLFHEAYRCRANVRAVYACVLDVDDGSPFDALHETFDGLLYIIHSTFSATEGAPRWRVVLPLDVAVGADAYDRVWRWLAASLEETGVKPDYAGRDACHAWAVPARPIDGYYEAHAGEGSFVSVADALVAIPAPEPIAGRPEPTQNESYDRRVTRARAYLEKIPGAISGSGGHLQTFKAALALVRGFGLEADDALAIMSTDYNPRCCPPWAASDLRHKVKQAMQRARLPYGHLAEKGMRR